MEALKMKEEMKLLNAEELEMVSGGTIDWRHFPEEVREASERGENYAKNEIAQRCKEAF